MLRVTAMLVRYQLAISGDGFIAPNDGNFEWLYPYGAVAMAHFGKFMKEIGGVIMGRATYDQQAAMGGAEMFGDMPTLVMTSRPRPGKARASLLAEKGAAKPALDKLKALVKRGDIWLMGGGETAAKFLDAGLIDRLELTTVPVALAAGRPLFEGAAGAHALKRLIHSRKARDRLDDLREKLTLRRAPSSRP